MFLFLAAIPPPFPWIVVLSLMFADHGLGQTPQYTSRNSEKTAGHDLVLSEEKARGGLLLEILVVLVVVVLVFLPEGFFGFCFFPLQMVLYQDRL